LDASSLKGFRYRSSAAAAATDEEDNDRQTDRHGRGDTRYRNGPTSTLAWRDSAEGQVTSLAV